MPTELTLAGLRVVREVALSGSFTAAARALGYSQPAISRQVAAVEAAAGGALFVREPRGVTLSPAGRVVADHAVRVLDRVEALEHDLAGLRDRLTGRVVVGAFPTASAVLVPRALALVGGRHPGLRPTTVEGSSPALLRRLRSGHVDVALVGVGSGLPEHDLAGLAPEMLAGGDLGVAVGASHRLAATARVPVAELAGEAWIAGRGAAGDPQFGAWPTLDGPLVRHAARSWPTRLGMVAAGLGITTIPFHAAASVPADVVVVGVDDPSWRGRTTVAVTRPSRGGAAAAVVTALHEVAGAAAPA